MFITSLSETGVDLGFFLGGDVPLTYGVTDWRGKQILKVNTQKASSRGVGVGAPCTLPPISAPVGMTLLYRAGLFDLSPIKLI